MCRCGGLRELLKELSEEKLRETEGLDVPLAVNCAFCTSQTAKSIMREQLHGFWHGGLLHNKYDLKMACRIYQKTHACKDVAKVISLPDRY